MRSDVYSGTCILVTNKRREGGSFVLFFANQYMAICKDSITDWVFPFCSEYVLYRIRVFDDRKSVSYINHSQNTVYSYVAEGKIWLNLESHP